MAHTFNKLRKQCEQIILRIVAYGEFVTFRFIILNLQSLNGHFIPEKMGLKMEADGPLAGVGGIPKFLLT